MDLPNPGIEPGSPALQADSLPAELFQILKDDAVKVLNMPANLGNSEVAIGLEKVNSHPNSQEGRY